MKKQNKKLFALLVICLISIMTHGVFAEETPVATPYGAMCSKCGSLSMRIIQNGYTTGWYDYEGDYCIHGYANGYDMGQFNDTYSATKQCSSCGHTVGPTLLDRQTRRVCHGY